MAYTKTTWVNNETIISAANMNHIEDGLETAAAHADTNESSITTNNNIQLLNAENVPNTTQSITYDSGGNLSQIVHTRNGSAVRTDVFTYTSTTITEVRTLSNGAVMTIVTDLNTLAVTTTYSES